MTTQIAVEAQGLAYAYGERRALQGIDFSVPSGSVHGFLGPNGSGKSTLFKILATILPFREGRVQVLGLDLSREMAALRRRIGVVFQSPALDRKLSVRQNLTYGGHLQGLSGAQLNRRVDELLERGRLEDRAGDSVGDLSGGLRRRVEIAKGLLHAPDLVLLDEPSTGLDPGARQDLWRFLGEQEGLTVLFTTHLMDEAEHAQALTILDSGAVVAAGTPEELRSSVGGEVLEIETADPEGFAATLQSAMKLETKVLDGRVRVEGEAVHDRVAELMRGHGDAVRRISLSHPTLEDVFIQRTGHRLEEE